MDNNGLTTGDLSLMKDNNGLGFGNGLEGLIYLAVIGTIHRKDGLKSIQDKGEQYEQS